MSVSITGTLIEILPTQEGESQRGKWIRGGFVIEHGEEIRRKAHFSLFGEEKVAQIQTIPVGTPVQVQFNPDSREYGGRWYADNRCLSVLPLAGNNQPAQQQAYNKTQPAAWSATPVHKDDDLPF